MTTDQPARPKAYSYVRFSTPEQQRGDSFRRQVALAREYATRHGLDLDESLDFRDLGRSAYRGAHAETGKLAVFLDMLREGQIASGSYLLVESLDRLSRQDPWDAVHLLDGIVRAGVVVVTLFDGKSYSRASRAESKGMDLMIAVMFMIRAHEESETKGRRLRHAWEQKRAKAAEGERLTVVAPAWLRATDGGFEVIEEYAETVRRIFAMALQGMGRQGIASALNAEGVPTFEVPNGRSRRDGSRGWYASYIGKILTGGQAVGTLTPCSDTYEDGKAKRTAHEPIPGYYPAVIDQETWAAVQALRSARKPTGAVSRGTPKNPLGGLLRCACGRAVVRANKGSGPNGEWAYYVCLGTKEKGEGRCSFRPIKAGIVEAAVMEKLPAALRECPADGERAATLRHELGAIAAAIAFSEKTINALLDGAGGETAGLLRSRVDAAEARRAELREQAATLQAELDQIAPGIARRRTAALADAMDAEAVPVESINAVCRSVFTHVLVDPAEGVLRLQWRQGGASLLPFALPTRKRRKARGGTPVADAIP